MKDDLIERLKAFVKAYEEELSDDPYGRSLIEEAITALSAPLPDEVEQAIKELKEAGWNGGIVNLIERLARKIEWHDKNAAAWKADYEQAQQRIDELDEIRRFHIKEIDRLDAALEDIENLPVSYESYLSAIAIARKARAGD